MAQQVPDVDELEMEYQHLDFMEEMIDLGEFIENRRDEGEELQAQQLLVIQGIPVSFPGQPNPNQWIMMENIILSLSEGKNVLIESPTGSGKTLAFLCATLAWVHHQHQNQQRVPGGGETKKPVIYYTVKTHAQVSTVLKELRKTSYASPHINPLSNLKVAILGSRRQLCTNQDVIRNEHEESRDDACKRLHANFEINRQQQGQQLPLPTCPLYKPEEDDYFKNNRRCANGAIRDIEDITNSALVNQSCAYFGSRRQLASSDIVICPYNYIISSHIRNSVGIHLTNNIVIFDEGHNLQSVSCEEGSVSITLRNLRQIIDNCNNATRNPQAGGLLANKIRILSAALLNVWEWMVDPQTLPQTNADVLDAFRDFLDRDTVRNMENAVDYVINAIENEPTLGSGTAQEIRKFVSVLKLLYTRNAEGDGDNDDMILQNYFLQLENEGAVSRRLNIICLNASTVFGQISRQARSVLVTSATLSPLDSFQKDLGIPFEAPISLDQGIPASRYWITKVGSGPNGLELNLKSTSREVLALQKEVGQLVLKVCQTVPNGVLVFFPSNPFLQKMKRGWEQDPVEELGGRTIMSSINDAKHVVSEADMTDAVNTRELLRQYREQSRIGRGAVIFGILRGKLSEGVDFQDQEARAVISLGIPFAPPNAPTVFARKSSTSQLEYWRWYNTNAIRALSQCLGRSVRHQEDWGAMIMVDQRLIERAEDFRGMMPQWIEAETEAPRNQYNNFNDMIRSLQRFVAENNR
ncbi:Fanconi anemia group J protein [Orchesella cincta]|uniref:Fanconi anemia group J protein n=1 Tax=Orchesella cincta TaxID=48709 RepID=A0A1D2MMS3_ORCCI|nr:Fanconi anemia group J protein [Orchesella cincta]